MTTKTVILESRRQSLKPSRWNLQLVLAFVAVYIVWGSTYLAIRVVVATVPPLFAAALRFIIAGGALYAWARLRGSPAPSRLEWRNLCVLGAMMFLAAYGALFWAEKSIPSGVASVLVATIPVWTALFEIFVFKKERVRPALVIAICLGLAGVGILALRSNVGGLNLWACLAILGAEISWSLGSVLSKSMALPSSKLVTAGTEMLTGGVMLFVFSALAGELKSWPPVSCEAAAALAYLIVAGSLIGFTAFIWLLGRMPATTVSSYAYVNPVIALAIGHWWGNEILDRRTIIGASLVLISVLLILLKKSNPSKAH